MVFPDEVVVVPGGKPIMFFTMLALIDEGDEVIYPNPGFPIYESMINYVGGTAVPIQLHEERDFALDVNELAALITDRTKLIILNSPQNPTGGILPREDIEQVARIIGDRNIMVLSDEIYSRLQFEGEPFSIMQIPGMQERTILLDGFSKTYAMTGWRMGYGVMRPDLAAQMTRLMTNSNSCTASFTQMAGIEALRGDQSAVSRMCAEFKHRSEIFVARAQQDQGLQLPHAQGRVLRFPEHYRDGMEIKASGRCTAGADRRGRAFRHGLRQVRRRLSALQRGQFARQSCRGPGPHRTLDQGESLTGFVDARGGAHRSRPERPGAHRPQHIHRTRAGIDDRARRQAMALKDSSTGKVIRDYSFEQLRDAANLMRGY